MDRSSAAKLVWLIRVPPKPVAERKTRQTTSTYLSGSRFEPLRTHYELNQPKPHSRGRQHFLLFGYPLPQSGVVREMDGFEQLVYTWVKG